jgi:hypothetical protein
MDIDSVAFAYSDGFVSRHRALRHSLNVAAGMYVSGRSTIGYGYHTDILPWIYTGVYIRGTPQ